MNCGANSPITLLKSLGATTRYLLLNAALTNAPYCSAVLPFFPRALSWLISSFHGPLIKNSESHGLCIKHCNVLFMKQVFPRFRNPTIPSLVEAPSSFELYLL